MCWIAARLLNGIGALLVGLALAGAFRWLGLPHAAIVPAEVPVLVRQGELFTTVRADSGAKCNVTLSCR